MSLIQNAKQNLIKHRAMLNALSDADLKIGDRIDTITTRSAVTAKNGYPVAAWGLSEYQLAWGTDGRLVWKYVSGTGKYTSIPDSWTGLPSGRPEFTDLKYWARGKITE